MHAATTSNDSAGTFLGTEVRSGRGGGLASGPALSSGRATHFHAARLPGLGDVVLSVTRVFDATTAAALSLELRAFAASAPGRGALAELPIDAIADAPGAIAAAALELSAAGDEADERRPATLVRCVVTDAVPTAAAARGVADWLRTTWETELSFASWPAVRGTIDAFAIDGGEAADWALEWLLDSEHHVDETTPSAFLKVLSSAWLEPSAPAGSQPDAATTPG
jgi:hypothetical protein